MDTTSSFASLPLILSTDSSVSTCHMDDGANCCTSDVIFDTTSRRSSFSLISTRYCSRSCTSSSTLFSCTIAITSSSARRRIDGSSSRRQFRIAMRWRATMESSISTIYG